MTITLMLTDEIIETMVENIEKEMNDAMFKTSMAIIDIHINNAVKHTEEIRNINEIIRAGKQSGEMYLPTLDINNGIIF